VLLFNKCRLIIEKRPIIHILPGNSEDSCINVLSLAIARGWCEREKTVVVFIAKQIIKLHLDYYIRKAASILQIDKKHAKLP
jgi:hypothetical protein